MNEQTPTKKPIKNPNLFLLDSGAYSVWSQGEELDIDDYIRFCLMYPEVDYYVSLDVILGVKGDPSSKTPETIAEASRRSWSNYLKMIRRLPEEKVIPVFHRGDSFDWLEKYMDYGSPYIGIGQAGQGTYDSRMLWLDQVKSRILDSNGRPTIKTHGFALTSMSMMKALPWHSVDSSSWVQAASFGIVHVPKTRGGIFVYDTEPFVVAISPKSSYVDKKNWHVDNLSPHQKEKVLEYIQDVMGLKIGKHEIKVVEEGYKPEDNEIWWDKQQLQVMVILERGVGTSHQMRYWCNMRFLQKVNDVIDVDHIYFAGAEGSVALGIEKEIGRRLMSYYVLRNSKRSVMAMERFLDFKTA